MTNSSTAWTSCVKPAARRCPIPRPTAAHAADGGRQLARSRLMLILELCERLLTARDNREVVWFSRASTFDPGQGYSQPDETAPAWSTLPRCRWRAGCVKACLPATPWS